MSIPFFSVVIPAYNCESIIDKTINSVLNQTFRDFELIVVDDGSTDGTLNIIKNIKDSRITTFTIKNGGPGNARNFGISKTNGKYLILIDSDDFLEENNFEIRSRYLLDDNVDLLIGAYKTMVMADDKVVDVKQTDVIFEEFNTNKQMIDNIFQLMEKQLMYVIWNKVYKIDIIKENNITFPPYKSCEDRLFNLDYFKYVNNCIVTNQILYSYTFDGKNSLTNKFLDNKFKTFQEFYLKAKELSPKDDKGFSALFLKGVFSCFIPLHTPSCPLGFRKKISYIKEALKSQEVIHAAQISDSNGGMRKLFRFIFNIRVAYVHYLLSFVVYKISTMDPKIIEKLKQNF